MTAAAGKHVPVPAPPVMTADEVAELLRVHKSTISRLLKAGKIKSFRVGADHRFTRQAIDEWRKAQEYPDSDPQRGRKTP
jgi:excisionase family DNA binding protein